MSVSATQLLELRRKAYWLLEGIMTAYKGEHYSCYTAAKCEHISYTAVTSKVYYLLEGTMTAVLTQLPNVSISATQLSEGKYISC